ncbi:15746_t:CDS:2, partial [Cetraspora pellucida]
PQDDNIGYIYARVLPGIGEWKKWSSAQVMKIIKKQNLDMLNPTFIAYTENNKLWSMPINIFQDIVEAEMNLELVFLEYSTILINDNIQRWALKKNQKLTQREPTKKMTEEIKSLLEIMLHTGTANLQQKMSAQQMHEDFILYAAHGEIEADNIPKIITIANWISGFSKK